MIVRGERRAAIVGVDLLRLPAICTGSLLNVARETLQLVYGSAGRRVGVC